MRLDKRIISMPSNDNYRKGWDAVFSEQYAPNAERYPKYRNPSCKHEVVFTCIPARCKDCGYIFPNTCTPNSK